MADKEEWNEVDVPKEEEEKVQYEVEGEETEEVQASKEPEVKQKKPEVKEDVPEELDGIETKGAQKRIKQLIRQRKERDEQIQKLIQANETLQNKTTQQRNDFTKVSKLNLDASEKQLKDLLCAPSILYHLFLESTYSTWQVILQQAILDVHLA